MKKSISLMLVILMASVLLIGCKSSKGASAFSMEDSPSLSSAAEQIMGIPVATDYGDASNREQSSSREMSMDEIEAVLGYRYVLPDASQYTGTISASLEEPVDEAAYITLKYSSDAFDGVVIAMKKRAHTEPKGEVSASFPELKDAGTMTIDGIEVHFLGYTPNDAVVAFWEQNGFSYLVKGELDTTPAMIPLVRLFSEKGDIHIDPVQTVNAGQERPEEKPMEDIEAELGYGYKLPDEGTYHGRIVSMVEGGSGELGRICLQYTSEDFDGGEVYITKSKSSDTGNFDEFENWPGFVRAGTETVNGTEVQFLGDTQEHRLVAYWDRNGFHYVVNCASGAANVDIMQILSLFVETD